MLYKKSLPLRQKIKSSACILGFWEPRECGEAEFIEMQQKRH
jgi:hypothetical protein